MELMLLVFVINFFLICSCSEFMFHCSRTSFVDWSAFISSHCMLCEVCVEEAKIISIDPHIKLTPI